MQIEKNLPLANPGPKSSRRYRDALSVMEVGDSIVVDQKASCNIQGIESELSGFKFTIRTRGQNLPAGQARCWRVA